MLTPEEQARCKFIGEWGDPDHEWLLSLVARLQQEQETARVDAALASAPTWPGFVDTLRTTERERNEAQAEAAQLRAERDTLLAQLTAAQALATGWKEKAVQHKTHGDSYRVGSGWALEDCAEELESALAAAPPPEREP